MSAPVQPGEILASKYKVERVLGVGGMGVVVSALHVDLDERVAIKFMLEEALSNEEAVERFAREARAAVRIKSEHVARVSDVGKLENGAPYMVMEYLEGEDLGAVIDRRKAIPIEESVEYVLQACEAIAEAHSLGIVHRDLKPTNLFLAERPGGARAVKVLDFGISKATGRSGSKAEMALTKTTAVMGSPFYMSPEQMRASKDADARADIWALGVILYELISGKLVFDAPSMPELCARVLTEEPVPLAQVRPGVPAAVNALVMRCLEKDLDKRFQSVGELAAALAEHAPKQAFISLERIRRVLGEAAEASSSGPISMPIDRAPVSAVTAGSGGSRAAQSATLANWDAAKAPVHKSGSKRVAAAIGAVLLIGAALLFARGRGGAGPVAPAASVPAREAPSAMVSAAPQPTVEPVVSPSASVDVAAPASASAPPPTARPIPGKPAGKPAPSAKPAAKKAGGDLFSDPR